MKQEKNKTNDIKQKGETSKIISDKEQLKGNYSNIAIVRHTDEEFLIDFLLQFGSEPQLVSRIIMSPKHIKRLRNAIDENIKKYKNKKSNLMNKK